MEVFASLLPKTTAPAPSHAHLLILKPSRASNSPLPRKPYNLLQSFMEDPVQCRRVGELGDDRRQHGYAREQVHGRCSGRFREVQSGLRLSLGFGK